MPDKTQVESLRQDLEVVNHLLEPASPKQLNTMLGRLRSLPSSRAAVNMSDEQAEMALFDQLEALEDLPADLVEIARKRAMKTCKFAPAPAEIMDLVKPEIEERQQVQAIIKALLMKYEKNWD